MVDRGIKVEVKGHQTTVCRLNGLSMRPKHKITAFVGVGHNATQWWPHYRVGNY